MTDRLVVRALQTSIANLRRNKIFALLIIILIGALIMMPTANQSSRAVLIVSVTVLLVKAETGIQPLAVIGFAIVLAICGLLAMTTWRVAGVCLWVSVALIALLTFSQWIFAGRGIHTTQSLN